MRKGEQTRQLLLAAAERLFCGKGYAETSVQDILNVVHGSKGGFYHHFASKDELLKTLCAQQADLLAAQCKKELEALLQKGAECEPADRLNLVLRHAIPLRKEAWSFTRILLPLLDSAEGLTVRMAFQQALTDAFTPLLQDALEACKEDESILPVVPGVEKPVLLLVQECWLQAALLLAQEGDDKAKRDVSALMDVLHTYRKAVEVLLDAPWGSIELIRLEEWAELR